MLLALLFHYLMLNMFRILCVLDRASSWYLNKGRPTWWHLLYYVNLLLNMLRLLIHPSSGACDCLVRYCVGCIVLTWGVLVLRSGIGCWWCGIRVQAEPLLKHCFSLHSDTTPAQPNHNVTPTRIEPEQYNPWNNSTNESQAPEDGCINIRNTLSIK